MSSIVSTCEIECKGVLVCTTTLSFSSVIVKVQSVRVTSVMSKVNGLDSITRELFLAMESWSGSPRMILAV